MKKLALIKNKKEKYIKSIKTDNTLFLFSARWHQVNNVLIDSKNLLLKLGYIGKRKNF